jgi:hypothetical protein
LEECDSPQGFQTFVNSNDAWAKFSHDLNNLIRDEIGAKYPIFIFGCETQRSIPEDETESETMRDNWKRKMNTAASLVDLTNNSSIYIPLSTSNFIGKSFENMKFDSMNQYQTSAIFASSIDTCTLQYRKKNSEMSMDTIKRKLNVMNSMTLSSLCSSIPFPVYRDDTMFEVFSLMKPIHQSDLLFSLSPGMRRTEKTIHPYSHSSIVRGITSLNLFPTKIKDDEQHEIYKDSKNHKEIFSRFNELSKSYHSLKYCSFLFYL